jgi:hypothetical protein
LPQGSLTPLEQLKRTLVEDLKAIWESDIKKPSHALNFAIEEYFIFKFVCLASYVFEKDEFIKEVSELRKSFEDPKDEGYLLSKAALTRIPADGFSEYAARVWEQIIDNKDLDLPTLKEMLATCRCDELMSEAVANFRIGAERLRDRLSQGVVVNTFLEETSELLVEAFRTLLWCDSFDHDHVVYPARALRWPSFFVPRARVHISPNCAGRTDRRNFRTAPHFANPQYRGP